MVRSGVRNVKSVFKVRTQASALDGTRPDLVGVDEDGAERVLIEAKFWAELTRRQPHDYLDRLPVDGPAVLLFLAPEERIVSLWPELRNRAQGAGKTLSDVDAERKCVSVDSSQRHLLLVSWTGLLDRMSARTRDEQDAEADIRQLRGLADFAEEGRFRPPNTRDDIGPDSRHMRDMKRIIDAANRTGNCGRMGVSKGLKPHSAFVRLRSVLEARRSCRVVWDPHWSVGTRWRDPVVARLRERPLGSDSDRRGQRYRRVRRRAERCCVCATRLHRSPLKQQASSTTKRPSPPYLHRAPTTGAGPAGRGTASGPRRRGPDQVG